MLNSFLTQTHWSSVFVSIFLFAAKIALLYAAYELIGKIAFKFSSKPKKVQRWMYVAVFSSVLIISCFIGDLKNLRSSEDDVFPRKEHAYNYDWAVETFVILGLVSYFGMADGLEGKGTFYKKENS